MKLTNKFNLPEPFVAAVTADDYVRGTADFTATELINPVRISVFSKKFSEEMVQDVSDRVWAMKGQMRHMVLERIARSNPLRYIVETRYEATLPGGKKVSAQIDLYDKEDEILYDWKDNSVWKFMVGDTKEWEEQANINLFCMRANGFNPKNLMNVTFLNDWKKRKARTTKRDEYPKCAIHMVPLPMWSIGEAQHFILGRMKTHEEGAAMETPPLCTKKERWQRDAQFAVMKKGRKSAIRLLDNSDQAYAMLRHYEKSAEPGQRFFIEERPREPVRCLDFCPVAKWCDYGRKAQQEWEQQELIPNEEK